MPAFHVRLFDKNSSQVDYTALNQHINRIRRERYPDDPPIPVDETVQNLQSIPPFADLKLWAAWNADQNEIVALGHVVILRLEENQHMAQFEITVLPENRRQGLGRQMLSRIAEVAQVENRRLLMTSTADRIPGGEAFMTRLGAKKGLETHTNQLCLADLDRDLISSWLARGQENLAEFDLGFWDGAYPESQLQAIADLTTLTNQQPLGELEIEEMHSTPEQLRQVETNLFARGSQRWTFYLVDRATGKFAGYTETVWNPNRPEVLRQDMTGVFPQYRNRGLGRWLKAAMVDKVLKERSQVKYVRTGNADTNVAMLKINTALGFKPYMAEALWQVDLQDVLAYLQAHNEL
ncbi:MAG: GNAT family N-acetyltransferase [Anaerolineales bacterium]|nr:GNAT family N-acetyltransferase [Anaerolineales bacterium]